MTETCRPEVQAYIDELNAYEWSDTLEEFNIFHLYPQGLAFSEDMEQPEGFVDSRFFNAIGYNDSKHQRRDLGMHDEIKIRKYTAHPGAAIDIIRIFVDGSTLIRFAQLVRVDMYQSIDIFPSTERKEFRR